MKRYRCLNECGIQGVVGTCECLAFQKPTKCLLNLVGCAWEEVIPESDTCRLFQCGCKVSDGYYHDWVPLELKKAQLSKMCVRVEMKNNKNDLVHSNYDRSSEELVFSAKVCAWCIVLGILTLLVVWMIG